MEAANNKDPLTFVRKAVTSAIGSVMYHEEALLVYQRRVILARDLLKRANVDYDATERVEDTEDGEDDCTTVEQYVCYLVDNATEMVKYHEKEIRKAYDELALVKIMLARGGYTTAEVDVVSIEAAERDRRRS